jgi:SAM-dependent methyltransferase
LAADDVSAFVHSALPPAPVRVLEVGAGNGELAEELTSSGYEVVAIDPESGSPEVRPVALEDLDEPDGSFDAAVAVVSLHHVEPLHASCVRLAELLPPEAALVIDEFDVDAFDERAASWLIEHRESEHDHAHDDPRELVAELRDHLHSFAALTDELGEWFAFETPVRGPYLYRWDLPEDLLDDETRLIAGGALPATGVRVVGRRLGAG